MVLCYSALENLNDVAVFLVLIRILCRLLGCSHHIVCGFWIKRACILIDLYEIISLSRGMVPILQGYEDAGDFSVRERLKTSAHVNLIYYSCVGAIALCGVILLIFLRKNWLVSSLTKIIPFSVCRGP